jgi:regulatory protein
VAELRNTELARARAVWQKKFDHPPEDAAERAKQMRFLASRGFGGDTIHRVVSGGDDD